jgi:exonuclease SbcC
VNPQRVWAQQYRTFESLEFEMPDGCAAVIGPNGAGKSSVIQLVDLALFGGRDLARYHRRGETADLVIGMEFEHDGMIYRVRRAYSPSGRGKSVVSFEQAALDTGAVETTWLPLTRETARETDALIERIVGMSRRTFRASAYVAQGDGAAFTEAQPRERKAILAEVLALDLYERLHEVAGQQRSGAAQRVAALEARVEALAETASQQQAAADTARLARRHVEMAKAMVDATTRNLAEFTKRREQGDALAAAGGEARRAADAARDTAAGLEAQLASVVRRADAIDSDHEKLLALPSEAALDQQIATARQAEAAQRDRISAERLARSEHARLTEALANLTAIEQSAKEAFDRAATASMRAEGARSALVNADIPLCPTCGQTLEADARQAALDKADDAVGEAHIAEKRASEAWVGATAKREGAEAALAEAGPPPLRITEEADYSQTIDRLLETKMTVARLTATTRDRAEVHAARDDAHAKWSAAVTTLEAAEAKVAELREQWEAGGFPTTTQITECEAQLDYEKQKLEQAVAACAQAELLEAQATKAGLEVADLQAQITAARTELETLALLEAAFGRDGIPAMITETVAIPQIEADANRILAELGTSFTVEVRTQRDLKGGGQADALDIVVDTPTGPSAYEDFSGGERTRVNLALRIALARLLARRGGASVSILAVDEPDGLDESGMQRLADVLKAAAEDFEHVLLVSHVPTLADAFDRVIEVQRDGDTSVIAKEGAPA